MKAYLVITFLDANASLIIDLQYLHLMGFLSYLDETVLGWLSAIWLVDLRERERERERDDDVNSCSYKTIINKFTAHNILISTI